MKLGIQENIMYHKVSVVSTGMVFYLFLVFDCSEFNVYAENLHHGKTWYTISDSFSGKDYDLF